MVRSSAVVLGPLRIPLSILLIAGSWFLAWLAGRIILSRKNEEPKQFSDILGSPVLPFLLGWKLSLVITDFNEVSANPLLILYSAGSSINFLIGGISGILWALRTWYRCRPKPATNRALLTALTVLVLTGTVTAILNKSANNEKGLPLPADAFILERSNGEIVTPETLRGQTAVLNFWASWCPPCRAEMPMLNNLASDEGLGTAGIYAVNVTTAEKHPDAGVQWMKENGFQITLLLDTAGTANNYFGISSLPTTVVLDSRGRVVDIFSGVVSRGRLLGALRRAEKK